MRQEGPVATADTTSEGKELDGILAQWRRERPDIDPSPMAVCGAIWRTSERLHRAVAGNLKGAGLDFSGFDVLMTLRRQGRDVGLSPSALAKEMMLSTSAMTNRLDRLESRGLIERVRDAGDRRALKTVLTEEGFALIDGIVRSHVEMEAAMLAGLSEAERTELRRLLAKIGGGA